MAPHPDDEVVGCGGLISKVKNAGGRVYVLYLAVGDTKDFTKRGISTGNERVKEIEKVVRYLKIDGYDLVFKGNEYHLKLDLLGQKKIMDAIERKSSVSLEKIKPTMICIPPINSYNQDHRIATEAAHASLRPASQDDKHFVKYVLSYEEPSDSWSMREKIEPNFFIKLSKKDLDAKIEAMNLYKSQARTGYNTRSSKTFKNLANLRGAQTGTEMAEAYLIYRMVV